MSTTPVALRGYCVAKRDVVIIQPFQAKTAKLPLNVSTIRGASVSNSYQSVLAVVPFYAAQDNGANLRPHRSNPRLLSTERYRSSVRKDLQLITSADILTSSVFRSTGADLSLSGRIPPRFSSVGLTLGRHRTVMGAAHSRSRASNSLEILVNPDSFNKELLSRVSILKEPYKRPFFLGNCHVETIFASFYRSLPKLTYERELLKMADGGTVAVDWPIDGEEEGVWKGQLEQDVPVLILLPGLTGGSGDTYVRHMAVQGRKAGWRVAVFNSRGCADSPITTPKKMTGLHKWLLDHQQVTVKTGRFLHMCNYSFQPNWPLVASGRALILSFYSASFTEDLRQVVKHVGSLYPNSRVYAVGWSLGANILVRYIGQEGEICPLAGAVSLCNPFNLVLADENFHKGFNNIYDKNLAGALKKIFVKHAHLFEGIGGDYNVPLAAHSKTVRDFDDGITRVSFGFKSVDDYYFYSSSSRNIKDVRIPLLCIQAEDDPIAPSAGIPRADIEANSNCALVVTPAGGHLGWIAGRGGLFGAPWTDPLVIDYLRLLDKSLQTGTAFAKSRGQAGDVQLVGVETRKTVGEKGGEETVMAEPIVRR